MLATRRMKSRQSTLMFPPEISPEIGSAAPGRLRAAGFP
jgi:hypothetical protein